jgi:predicted DNA-binding transcriptional regulator YafY
LRSFAIDAITVLSVTSETAIEIDESELNRELESGYGIFSGVATQVARLRFKPEIARWISRETWHPEQVSEYDVEGYYLLSVPYSQDTELIMEILKYADEVEVLGPPALRARIRKRVIATQALYSGDQND